MVNTACLHAWNYNLSSAETPWQGCTLGQHPTQIQITYRDSYRQITLFLCQLLAATKDKEQQFELLQ